MTDHSDLSIRLRVVHDKRGVVVVDHHEFVYPGWLLRVDRYGANDVVVAETQLGRDRVLEIAQTLDEAIGVGGTAVVDAVIAADDLIREDLIRQLRHIETQVARLPMLRAALADRGVDIIDREEPA